MQKALDAVERLNMPATGYGLVSGVTPDGKRFDAGYSSTNDHGKHVFFGENMCAAMTFMYRGRRDTGLEIARRIYKAVALTSCSPWNQRCLIDAETGMPVWGDDYYSNMVVWGLPAAWEGADLSAVCRPEGLVHRLIDAAAGA